MEQGEIYCRECDVKLVQKDFALKEVKRIAGNYYCWKCAAKILGEEEKPKALDPKIQLPTAGKNARGRAGRRGFARPVRPVGGGGGGGDAPAPRARFGGRRMAMARSGRRTLGSGLPRYEEVPEEGVAPVRPRPQIRRGITSLAGGVSRRRPGMRMGMGGGRPMGFAAAPRRAPRPAPAEDGGEGAEGAEGGEGAPPAEAGATDNKMLFIGIGAGALVLVVALILIFSGGKDKKPGTGSDTNASTPTKNKGGATGIITPNYEAAKKAAQRYMQTHSTEDYQTYRKLLKNCNNPEVDKLQGEFPSIKPPSS